MIKPDQFVLLLIGWALGFPSALLLDWLRRILRRAELKKAIRSELNDLRYFMARHSFLIRSEGDNGGSLSNDFLEWLDPIVRQYKGPAAEPSMPSVIDALRSVSEQDRLGMLLRLHNPGRGLYPKEYAVPFLTTHVAELSVLPLAFQSAVLRVKSQLDMFNQHVAFVQKRHDMTFSVSAEMSERVSTDFREGLAQLAEMAKRLVDAVSNLPEH